MRDHAESLVQKLPSDNECSLITTWYGEGDNRELYFSLCSTNEWEEGVYTPSPSTRIVVETISLGELVECIPDESSNGVASGEITSELEGGENHSFEFTSDVRMQLRSSQEMRKWGHKWPALCFEHWTKTENERDIGAEDERELLEALEREFDIDLYEHSEYVETIVIAIENRSCRVTFNESSEELSEAWFSEDNSLSDEQLLDLFDTWELVLGTTTVSEIDLTLRREEYGTILYESEISLSDSPNISREEALELAREQQQPSTVKVTAGDEVNRYHLPSIEAPGASDEILKASKNGRLLDEYSMPLMRTINLDIQVNSPTKSPSSGRVLPPTLYSDPSYSVGQYRWDTKITSSENDELETWVVDEQEDYDEIMNVIHEQMASVVKISEPYLRPDMLNDLVQEGDSDLDLRSSEADCWSGRADAVKA